MEDKYKYEEIAAATRLMLSERRQSIAKIAEESGINEFRIKIWRKRCFPTSIMAETEYSPHNYTLFCQFILYIYLSRNHLKIMNAGVHNSTQIPKQRT